MRATEHTPRGPFYLIERRHCLAEIVERGAGVVVERLRVNPPHLERAPGRGGRRGRGLFSADGLFAPTEEPDFEFDGDDGFADGAPLPDFGEDDGEGELDELTSADFGEDPYLHVDT